jgi:hypothetical protein
VRERPPRHGRNFEGSPAVDAEIVDAPWLPKMADFPPGTEDAMTQDTLSEAARRVMVGDARRVGVARSP